jgi:hypothetical protein
VEAEIQLRKQKSNQNTDFSLVFCFHPYPVHSAQSILRKPRFLVLASFSPWILKTNLGFLEIRTKEKYYKYLCVKEEEREGARSLKLSQQVDVTFASSF